MSQEKQWENRSDPPGFNPLTGVNPIVAERLLKEKEAAELRKLESLHKNIKTSATVSSSTGSEDIKNTDDNTALTKGDLRKILEQINASFNIIETSLERSEKTNSLLIRFAKELLEIIEKKK